MRTDNEIEQWLAIRKRESLEIDPETAEVEWSYGQILDPYGVYRNLPEECDQIGRVYFACRPGSDIWVCFYDLPQWTRERLWEKYGRELRAGLISINCEDASWAGAADNITTVAPAAPLALAAARVPQQIHSR